MPTLAFDEFARADQNPLGSPWLYPTGQSLQMQLLSGAISGVGSSGQCRAYNNSVTWPNDQWCQATVTTISDGDIGLALRISATGDSCYRYVHRTVANGGILLSKVVAGVYTTLAANTGVGGAAGDIIYMEAVGTSIVVKVNGTQVFSVTDSALASGNAGVHRYNTTSFLDNWFGGGFTSSTTTLATDSFTRADANPLGSPWLYPTGQTLRFQLVSNSVGGVTSSGHCPAYYSGISWPNDQWCQATVTTLTDGDIGLAARISTSAQTFYSYSHRTVANGGIILEKQLNGNVYQPDIDTTFNPAVNDVIYLECYGSNITVKVNGIVRLSATDTDIASGNAGIFRYNTTSRIDDWSAGSFGAGGSSPSADLALLLLSHPI